MASQSQAVWWRPGGRGPFALDPKKPALPQIAATAAAVGLIVGGPLLGLAAIAHYPPLVPDQAIYGYGLGAIAALFAASFVLIPERMMPRSLPLPQRLLARAGWGLCGAFLILGLAGVANGFATPLSLRDVPAVARHETRERDPARRTYYVSIRPWPGARAVVDLGAPAEVYAALDLPVTRIGTPQAQLEAMPDRARVRLAVGEGRLGLAWLKGVGLAPSPAMR